MNLGDIYGGRTCFLLRNGERAIGVVPERSH